jgi:hypothetical protein
MDTYMRHRERLQGSDHLERVESSRALNALYNVFTPSDFTGLIAMSTSCLGLAGSIGEPDTAGRPRLTDVKSAAPHDPSRRVVDSA